MNRRFAVLCLLVGLGLLAGCATAPPLEGAWVMLASDYHEGAPLPAEPAGGAPVKILADGRFAFGTQIEGRVPWAGGGRYEFTRGQYVEIPDYHSVADLVGERLEFDCRFEDGLWFHHSRFRAAGRNFSISEVWRRLAPPERKLRH